jgi:CubicO group peptidase (beta-lactamase class C family)
MRLVEEGLVDLDAPLTRYLPDFTIQTRFQDAKPITIRSILSHQAGLPRNRCYWLVSQPGDKDLLKEITDSVKYCHTTFPVGGRYKYTNLGPDVLGYLIEQTRGESFAHYMQKNLLAPIGMESSAFLAADIPAQREIALGYAYDKGDYYPLQQDDIPSLPSGNLYSTRESRLSNRKPFNLCSRTSFQIPAIRNQWDWAGRQLEF